MMNWGKTSLRDPLKIAIRALCALAGLCLGLGAATPALASGAPVTATASSIATLVEPLGLYWVQDLQFGRIAARPTAGTVTVDANTGNCSVTGTILEVGSCQVAEFAGYGTRSLTLRIHVPNTVTLTGPGGATMTVDTLTLGTAPGLTYLNGNGNGLGSGNRRYQINSSTGIFTVRVGARLNVGANQTPGTYTGTFTMTVQYQ